MPDDMYAGMMAERQRNQAFADQHGGLMIRSPVDMPWDQWFADQRNPPMAQPPDQQPYVAPPAAPSMERGFYGSSNPMTWDFNKIDQMYQPAPVEQPSWVNETTTIANPLSQIPMGEQYNTIAGPGPVAPTPTPGLPSWMPPDTTTIAMPNGATGYNINGMIYDQTGSIISSGVGPVAP